jgi:hypothetical protein
MTVRFRTVTATDDALAQLDALLSQYDKAMHGSGGLSTEDVMAMISRLQAAIARLATPTSTYVWDMERQRTAASLPRLRALVGIVMALRGDIQAGWLASVIELAHADTYSDYLEMAEGLNAQQYKDPAAVIAGTSLEVHLKSLAVNMATTVMPTLKLLSTVYATLPLNIRHSIRLQMSALMDHGRDYEDTGKHRECHQCPFGWHTGPALGVTILMPPAVTVVIPQTPAHE